MLINNKISPFQLNKIVRFLNKNVNLSQHNKQSTLLPTLNNRYSFSSSSSYTNAPSPK